VADLPGPSLRKGILRGLAWSAAPGGGVIVRIVPGPKLDVEPFLRQAFALPHAREWVRIRARQTGPEP
jgi:hypothetical protein